MSEETQVATREPQNVSTRSAAAALIPPVDIVEDETGLPSRPTYRAPRGTVSQSRWKANTC
jgi:hypothetical protein